MSVNSKQAQKMSERDLKNVRKLHMFFMLIYVTFYSFIVMIAFFLKWRYVVALVNDDGSKMH